MRALHPREATTLRTSLTHALVPLLLLGASLAPLALALPDASADCAPDALVAGGACAVTAKDGAPPWAGSWWGHCNGSLDEKISCDAAATRCEGRACETRQVSAAPDGATYSHASACGTRDVAISVNEPGVNRVSGGGHVDDDCDGYSEACAADISVNEPGVNRVGWNSTGSADCDDTDAGCALGISVNQPGLPSDARCAAGAGGDGRPSAGFAYNSTGGALDADSDGDGSPEFAAACNTEEIELAVEKIEREKRCAGDAGATGVGGAAARFREGGRTIGAGVVADIVEIACGGGGGGGASGEDGGHGGAAWAGCTGGGHGGSGGAYASGHGAGGWLVVFQGGAAQGCYAGVELATSTPYAACWP